MQAVRYAFLRNAVRLQLQPCLMMQCRASHLLHQPQSVFVPSLVMRFPMTSAASVTCQLQQSRTYAKKVKKEKKEKKEKGGKKSGKPKVELSAEELNSAMNFEKFESEMQHALDHLKQEYIEQLSVRSAPGALDHLAISTADGNFPLIQLAQVAQKNPQLIVINMATAPQYLGDVKKAIAESGMNLNPQQDGTTLFVPVPKITREHREQLAKGAKTLCDKAKERLRDVQNRYVRDLRKKKDLSSDLVHNIQETIQFHYTSSCSSAEDMMHIKQRELLGDK